MIIKISSSIVIKIERNNALWEKNLKRELTGIQYQNLSENFIRRFEDEVNWNKISKYQKLSEDFIREFKDEVNWIAISKYQNLSIPFLMEFKDELDINDISIFSNFMI